jgi:hypothetical protein
MPDEELWKNDPLKIDQLQGYVIETEPVYVMQTKLSHGAWVQSTNERVDRDEVTRIQAYHLAKDPDDTDLRVWRKVTVWTLDEVPGYGEGQTPPGEILARNEANTSRLAQENRQSAQ